jgi:hypothetical protein
MPGVNSVSGFPGHEPMKYSLADLTIDTGRQLVSRAASTLPKLSFDLLLALVRAAPNLVSLDELMRLVWPGVIVSPETRDDVVAPSAQTGDIAGLARIILECRISRSGAL